MVDANHVVIDWCKIERGRFVPDGPPFRVPSRWLGCLLFGMLMRVGEACVPGPTPGGLSIGSVGARATFRFGVCNANGVSDKISELYGLDLDLLAVSETHLTDRGLRFFRSQLKVQAPSARWFVHGQPVCPRGVVSDTGKFSGVGLMSRWPAHSLPHDWEPVVYSTGRLHLPLFMVFGFLAVLSTARRQAPHIQRLAMWQTRCWGWLWIEFCSLVVPDTYVATLTMTCLSSKLLKNLSRLGSLSCRSSTCNVMQLFPLLLAVVKQEEIFASFRQSSYLCSHGVILSLLTGQIMMCWLAHLSALKQIGGAFLGRFPPPSRGKSFPIELRAHRWISRDMRIRRSAIVNFGIKLKLKLSVLLHFVASLCITAVLGGVVVTLLWLPSFRLHPLVKVDHVMLNRRFLGSLNSTANGASRPGVWNLMFVWSRVGMLIVMQSSSLWTSILRAPGFRPSFQGWWSVMPGNRDFVQFVPDASPGHVIAEQVFLGFDKQFRALEQHLKSHQRYVKQFSKVSPIGSLYKSVRRDPPQPVELLTRTVKGTIAALDFQDAAIEFEAECDWDETVSFVHAGRVFHPIFVTPDKLYVDSLDGFNQGDVVVQTKQTGHLSDLFAAFHAQWSIRWQKHDSIPASQWNAIMEFARSTLSPVQVEAPVLSVSVLQELVRSKSAKTAAGLDGVSRDDLLALSPTQLGSVVSLYSRAEHDGSWPRSCMAGSVRSLAKTSCPQTAGDYRPVTVLSLVYRLWSSFHAKFWLRAINGALHPLLCGNRPGGRTSMV